MKKKLVVLLVIVAMIFVAACGAKEKPSEENKPEESQEAEEEGKEDESQENEGQEEENAGDDSSEDEYDDYIPELDPPDEEYDSPEAGMTLAASETYNQNRDKTYLVFDGGLAEEDLYYMEFYLYPASKTDLWTMSDEEYDASSENILNVLTVFKALDSTWTAHDLDKWAKWIAGIEEGSIKKLKTEGDYTIYYTMQKEYTDNLPEDVKPIYDGIIAELDAAKDQIVLYEPKSISDVINGTVVEFETTDLEGNTVSSKDIFAQNKYTMINFWASWCGPCIGELPELEELNKAFEEKGCGIIGILLDGTDPTGLADAREIIGDAKVTYLNVIDSMGLSDELEIQAVPTTIFVDSNGVIVGDAVVGAVFSMYESVMNELLGE